MILEMLDVQPVLSVVLIVAQCLAYAALFGKMGINKLFAILPFVAEGRLTHELYPKMRTFWRQFFVAGILTVLALYLNPFRGTGASTAKIYLSIASLVYQFFLIRLYWRLSKRFGKGFFYALFMTILPPVGLAILALGKSQYLGKPEFPEGKKFGPIFTFLSRAGLVLVSGVEILLFIAVVGFFTIRAYPPRILAQSIMNDTLENTKDVTGTGTVVAREDVLGDAITILDTLPASREKYFPDHSADKSAVVMAYVIGSDLEDRMGCSSVNIAQMIDATKQGSGLTFVVEAGGSQRWFTKGVSDATYGRYVIHDGTLEKVMDLPSDTCMSEPDTFADFLIWAKENYPADRSMLVMWDHGGGFTMGYGLDALNRRKADIPVLKVSELCAGLEKADLKLDVIGFDACLMQTLENAAVFEPYADYYLASEETEGGWGWTYTSAFGKLAQNPAISSEEFGKEMIASYDAYNTALNNGQPDTKATLSFVDLPRAKTAYHKMEEFYAVAQQAILNDSGAYADLSLAGSHSYNFSGNQQSDLIDFLTVLARADYEDKIYTDQQFEELKQAVQACVLYRNGDSAEGINGMAVSFPCSEIGAYKYDHDELTAFSLDAQRSLFDNFFSIMAAQNVKVIEEAKQGDFITAANAPTDVTNEDWYIKGFENYETQEAETDIPLTPVGDNSYKINLPEQAWDIILDVELAAYQKTDDGLLRYLGADAVGSIDETDNLPILEVDGKWVHINGQLVSYRTDETRTTDDGIIYTGTAKAMLNGTDKVVLNIEWEPVTGSDSPAVGYVTGYKYDLEGNVLYDLLGEGVQELLSKGEEQLQPGDSIEFLFDYYDTDGKLVKTETYGEAVRVVKAENLKVEDAPIEGTDVVFAGLLTDAYQRTMTTEMIEIKQGATE